MIGIHEFDRRKETSNRANSRLRAIKNSMVYETKRQKSQNEITIERMENLIQTQKFKEILIDTLH